MTIKEAAMVLRDFAVGRYDQNNHAYYACKTTAISIEEGWTVTTYAYYLTDNDKCSAPEPNVDIDMVVGDFTFGCTKDEEGEFSPWVVKNDGIEMPEDEDIRLALVDVLDELVDWNMEYCMSRCAGPSFEEEWDIDEIAEYIMQDLTYDQYLNIDGEISPFTGNIEEFAKEHYDDPKAMENIEYTILTREEAARYLAEFTDC